VLLYDNPISANALKVRFLLAELGLAYERREVPLAQPRPDWYLAVNPVGGVPALDDDGLVMAESNAILRYLAGREGRSDLYPRAPAERARVDQFLDRFATTFRAGFFPIEAAALGFVPGAGFGAGEPDLAKARAKERETAGTIALLERLVAGDGSVLGGGFTIADCCIAPKLERIRAAVVARDAFGAAGPVL
jgi:glutathione S-transferase